MTSQNVLITGGAGFIGSHIVEALRKDKNASIIIYDVQTRNNSSGDVVSVEGDIFSLDQLSKVMKDYKVSSVIHLIGNPAIPNCRDDPNWSFNLNVQSVHNVLEAMRLNAIGHLIFSSTAAVYGTVEASRIGEDVDPKPTTVYGFHKLAAELLIKAYAAQCGIRPTILRIFNVYGDLDKEQGVISLFIRNAFLNEPMVMRGGKQLRDFVHLRDVVEAFIKALTNAQVCENQIINVGSGVGLPISTVADLVKQHFPKIQVEYQPSVSREYSLCADVSRMKELLGVNPTDPFKGIAEFIEKCKKERANQPPAINQNPPTIDRITTN